jgi:hypothetical protein
MHAKLLGGLTAAAFIGYDIAGRPRVGLPFEMHDLILDRGDVS